MEVAASGFMLDGTLIEALERKDANSVFQRKQMEIRKRKREAKKQVKREEKIRRRLERKQQKELEATTSAALEKGIEDGLNENPLSRQIPSN